MNTWQTLHHKLSTKGGLYLGYGIIVLVCAFLFVLSKSITFSSSLQSRQDASGFDHQLTLLKALGSQSTNELFNVLLAVRVLKLVEELDLV